MFDALLEFLYPPVCVGCDAAGEYLCRECKKGLRPHSEMCPVCQSASPDYQVCVGCRASEEFPLEGIVIGFSYTDELKKLILALKFGHRSHVSGFLAERLSLLVQSHPQLSDALQSGKLVVTRVPSHWIRKYRVKGYNQSELLATDLAESLDVSVVWLTRRVRYTRSQTKLNRKKRLKNLIGAFGTVSTDAELKWDEIVLIVDDITTTWSTLVQVAHSISQKHPTVKVWGAVVGRHGV